MKRKVLSVFIAMIMTIQAIIVFVIAVEEKECRICLGYQCKSPHIELCSYCDLTHSAFTRFGFSEDGVTDERLHEFVQSHADTTCLSLTGHQNITDYSPLVKLADLRYLALNPSDIIDLSPLAELANLTNLSISNSEVIFDISPLAELENLEKLNLYGNQINDITPLLGMTNLKLLNLGNNQISDITPLKSLVNLRWLDLSDNPISFEQIDELRAALPYCKIVPGFVGNLCWWCYESDDECICKIVKCEICGIQWNEKSHWRCSHTQCPVCDEWDCTTEHVQCPICDNFDCTVNHTKCPDCGEYDDDCICLPLGHVLGNTAITIEDAMEILKYMVELPSVIEHGNASWHAARIVSDGDPGVDDVLEILRYLVELPSVLNSSS